MILKSDERRCLGVLYPTLSASALTAERTASVTDKVGSPLRTLETVAAETPQILAMSFIPAILSELDNTYGILSNHLVKFSKILTMP